MIWDEGLEKESATYQLASSDSRIIRSVAGPGSGKSFAIKRRIIRLLETGIDPDKLLAITFTRTAAADLRKEITMIGIKGCEKVTTKTIHSHALMILHRSEIQTIISRKPRMVIDHEIKPALRDIEFPPDTTFSDREDMLKIYKSAWANTQTDEPGIPKNETEEEFANRLIDWLKYHQGMLVGEVIPIALRYLQDNPASPEIGKYDTILVDEYQDLNRSEQEFIKLLSGNKNIVIVGDDDQSIYRFKYAYPEGIRRIDTLYGEYENILFKEIRRCPKYITQLASSLISKNRNRTLGELIPYERNQEGIVNILQWHDNSQEIDGIVKIIKNEIDRKLVKPEDVLILSPRRVFGYKIQDMLKLNGIPAKSYFREDVIKNKNVQRAYSLLYLLAFPHDKISLRYLLGYKASDFKLTQYKKLREYSDENNLSIREVLDSLLGGKIKISYISGMLNDYREILNDLLSLKRRLLEEPENIFEYFYKTDEMEIEFYEIVNLYQNILSYNTLENKDDEDYFYDWFRKIILKLSESIALPDSPENIDHVRIMSLHSSKGLNAKFVIMISMIDELMPFISDDNKQTLQDIEEEQRRLFYVAMTRCKSSENSYPGRLLISSFAWIDRIEALRIGLKANSKQQRQTQATRFLNDFGKLKPKTIYGNEFLKYI
jgi:superfamily I DNA/RNA helicase